MAPPLLHLKETRLSFGGTPLLEGAELAIAPGERICLVGRNGSGKSTLLKIAAGIVEADAGERFVHPKASLRYLAQEADFGAAATVRDYVIAGLGPTDDPHVVDAMLHELGVDGAASPATLSGGEARRAALIRVLAPQPDILLLDEPTNHLDLPAIEWLEDTLKAFKGALLMISHDRRFLENLSRSTVWLDRGLTRSISRGFAHFEAWRDEVLEQQELERHKLDRKIEREQSWMHGGVTGRRKRNVRRVREMWAMRQARAEERQVQGNVRLEASTGSQSGKMVIEAERIGKSYENLPIVADFTTRIIRGDRIGIVGPNGSGKTTLTKLLIGTLAPDTGTTRLGSNLEMLIVDQKRDALKPEWTVSDALTGGRSDQVIINGEARHVTSYMADFLFSPEQRNTPVHVLSGGERGRLMLARALSRPSNLLVLDEPTNDLDLETLDLLQELLADYPGTVILVSHDRDFLDRVVTSTIAPHGGGKWVEYAGGYTDMLAQRRGADLVKTPAKVAASKAATESSASAPSTAAKKKLSFKDKHALETLPATIAALQREIATLEKKLADPKLYAADPKTFAATSVRLGAAQGERSAAEERWLELEIMREELDA
jgi:ABC transport system ATP-binding/permease protein